MLKKYHFNEFVNKILKEEEVNHLLSLEDDFVCEVVNNIIDRIKDIYKIENKTQIPFKWEFNNLQVGRAVFPGLGKAPGFQYLTTNLGEYFLGWKKYKNLPRGDSLAVYHRTILALFKHQLIDICEFVRNFSAIKTTSERDVLMTKKESALYTILFLKSYLQPKCLNSERIRLNEAEKEPEKEHYNPYWDEFARERD